MRGRRAVLSLGVGLTTGTLAGLIGLGGAEFRLPAIVGLLGYPLRQAVPINLGVSAFTLGAALMARSQTLSLEPVIQYIPALASLVMGAVLGAFVGPGVALRLRASHFVGLVRGLLVSIGGLLIVEAFLPLGWETNLRGITAVLAGLAAGVGIGLVSSLLGVAGGELIIPTLIFVYGMAIKEAGTAAILVSLPTVLVGIGRWLRTRTVKWRDELSEVLVPMATGSVMGAWVGGFLAAVTPGSALKVLLGILLIGSALRGLGKH